MTDQRQRQIDEAAQKFADAIRESYQAVGARNVSAQEHNVEMMHSFFNGVLNNLYVHANQTLDTTQRLAEQKERQQEAVRALGQESVQAHMDFVNSLFSFYRSSSVTAAERG
jgi:ATP-dependent exoDNAse (exonuclease V) beta subunit